MESTREKTAVPAQKKGRKMNTEKTIRLASREEAIQFFEIVKKRLFDINNWDELCALASGHFTLTDADGNSKNKNPQPGDYFKIKIPAPKSTNSDGYDWVRIEKIDHNKNETKDEESIVIRVRPSENPSNKKTETAHFFDADATSSFMVKRKGRIITAAVYGRNEFPNITNTTGIINKIRNAIVGLAAMTGLAKLQWKCLVNGLVELNAEKRDEIF